MKTISIRELHEATGRYVRETRAQWLIVTERGQPVAVLKPYSAEEVATTRFPKRKAGDLPRLAYDSTRAISKDRDER